MDQEPETGPLRVTRVHGAPGGRRSRWWRRVGVGVAVVAQLVLAGGITAHYVTSGRVESELAAATTPPPAPTSWSATIHDVGRGGLHLRSEPVVMPGTSSRIVPADHSLSIVCGVGGDAVSGPEMRTNIWLRTVEGLYVSALYVTVPGRTHLPGCPLPDVPLVPLTPPTAPDGASDPGPDPAVAASSGGAGGAPAGGGAGSAVAGAAPAPGGNPVSGGSAAAPGPVGQRRVVPRAPVVVPTAPAHEKEIDFDQGGPGGDAPGGGDSDQPPDPDQPVG